MSVVIHYIYVSFSVYRSSRSRERSASVVLLYEVQHLDGGLDGGFCLVGIKATGANHPVVPVPADGRLHEGIRSTSWGNGYTIVGKPGETSAQLVLVYVSDGSYEGVELSVALCALLIGVPIDFET